jgi:hypothetical protein
VPPSSKTSSLEVEPLFGARRSGVRNGPAHRSATEG